MDNLEKLLPLIPWLILGIVLLAVVIKFVTELVDWLMSRFGIELKGKRMKNEDHELLLKTVEQLRSNGEKLDKFMSAQLDWQIDSMRYEILDFASALSNGRRYNKEQFDHILSIYHKYEQILDSNGLSNGQVTVSMEVIEDLYKEKLKSGF